MQKRLCSLLFKTVSDYNTNLQTLLTLIETADEETIIVAPEVCLTGFDYDNFEAVTTFADVVVTAIKQASLKKTVILTIIEKRGDCVYNFAKVFHNGAVVYERAKARLFKFGGEDKYFCEGSDEDVAIIKIDGVKIALLICFELRFKELWQKIEGADVIAVPSWWGVIRAPHFKTLTKALAVMNQCYVVASDSANEECTGLSAVISPQGEAHYNGNKPCLELEYNKKDIALMRRYMDVGIQ